MAAVTKVGDVLLDLRPDPITAGAGAEWGFRAGRASPGPLPAALHGRRDGERTRDSSPGHAGKESPHLAMMAASRGFSRLPR